MDVYADRVARCSWVHATKCIARLDLLAKSCSAETGVFQLLIARDIRRNLRFTAEQAASAAAKYDDISTDTSS